MKKIIPFKNKYQKNAFCFLVFLLLLALFCILWILVQSRQSQESEALIYQDGVLLERINLALVDTPYTFTVTGEGGCTNVIEVRPGSIGVLSADCPDQLCVHQGFTDSSLVPIVCLPNRLVIQVDAPSSSAQTDITAY